MKEATTEESKIDTMMTTTDIMLKETQFDIEFFAFLNAYVS
jgi:hypothetical protein